VILSDGDVVFQPRKIAQTGLWQAVDGHVPIYIQKEQMLDDVEQRYPARHYVMVDDKLQILNEMKQVWGGRLTTVGPRQGHCAKDSTILASFPPADVTIERIDDLGDRDLRTHLTSAPFETEPARMPQRLIIVGGPEGAPQRLLDGWDRSRPGIVCINSR